jgi:hypothetical protein
VPSRSFTTCRNRICPPFSHQVHNGPTVRSKNSLRRSAHPKRTAWMARSLLPLQCARWKASTRCELSPRSEASESVTPVDIRRGLQVPRNRTDQSSTGVPYRSAPYCATCLLARVRRARYALQIRWVHGFSSSGTPASIELNLSWRSR